MPDQNIISNIYINKALELYHQYCPVNKNYPYQIHTITQALQLDHASLVAIILYTNSKHDFNLEEHKHHFNDDIMYLVDYINKLTTIHDKPYAEQYIYFNTLLVTINSKLQEKAVLTTLAPLLYKVSIFNLESNNTDAQHISEIITNCYIPYFLSYTIHNDLAYLLQDLCFKIQDPEARNRIICDIHSLYPDMDNIIHNIEQQLRNIFSKLNIEASLSYRIKSPYSIWVKTLVKDIDITALNDILAFRAIVPNQKACYDFSKLIHLQYNTVKSCFVDYIKYPKNNGYQSIHLVISGGSKGNIELQIRSTTMHRHTQYGSAHNTYKANKYYVFSTKNNVNVIICNITLSYSNGIPSVYISIFTITSTINNNLYSYNTIPPFIQTQQNTNFVIDNTTTYTLSRTTTPEYITYYTNNSSLFIKDINSNTIIHQNFSRDINLNVSNVFEYKSMPLVSLSNIISIIVKSLQGIFPQAITYTTIYDDSNIDLTSNKVFLHITNIVKTSHNNKLLHTINNQVVLEQFSVKEDLLNASNTNISLPTLTILTNPKLLERVSISHQQSKDKILAYAIIFNCPELIPVLTQNGANVNAKDNYGKILLHYAALHGNINLVNCLIEHGADVDAKDNSGNTVLHYAALYGNINLVNCLIEHGADVDAKDNSGDTVLHYAVEDGNINLVNCLIEHGADINAKDNYGKTPLHRAVMLNKLHLIPILVNSGADVDAKDNSGDTVLHYSVEDEKIDVVNYLIGHGANVNAKNDYGETPLHHAAQCGNLDLVKLLIDGSADINAKANNNETLLHYAIKSGNLDLVKLLIDGGVDVNAKNDYGETPLHHTIFSHKLHLIPILVNSGADVNAKTDDGQTPLHFIIDEWNIDGVSYLIGHGADINAKANYGITPLHYAVWRNNLDLISILVNSGADVNAKNDYGETPLYCALKYDKHRIIPFLISCTKDLDTYDHTIFSYVECTILNKSNLLGEHLKIGEE